MFDSFIWILLAIFIFWLALAIWAAMIVYVYWDSGRRGLNGRRQITWVLVSLIPMAGFIAYLVVQPEPARKGSAPSPVSARPAANLPPAPAPAPNAKKRITMVKRPPAGPRELPTFVVAEREPAADRTSLAEYRDPPTWVPAAADLNPAAEKPAYSVTITEGPHTGDHFSHIQLPAIIGRGPECAIPLDKDAGISRNHAEIYLVGERLWLRDLGSRHGTTLNGRSIDEAPLVPGDEIQLATSRLVVEGEGR